VSGYPAAVAVVLAFAAGLLWGGLVVAAAVWRTRLRRAERRLAAADEAIRAASRGRMVSTPAEYRRHVAEMAGPVVMHGPHAVRPRPLRVVGLPDDADAG
jgi:hypothetical protein